MALAIATNNAALQAAAAASSVNRDMETSMARLSSGKRINSASDDAAGVAISSRLSAEIRGTDQAIRNSLDGQALIDTAEGAHNEIENILQRMREVAVQAANDTNNDQDRANLQAEMNALVTEIDRIASTTTWAGEKLMEAESTKFSFQVGAATGDKNQIKIDIAGMGSDALGFGSQGSAGLGIRVISDTQAHIAAAAAASASSTNATNSSSTFTSSFPFSAGSFSGNDFTVSSDALNLPQTGGRISVWVDEPGLDPYLMVVDIPYIPNFDASVDPDVVMLELVSALSHSGFSSSFTPGFNVLTTDPSITYTFAEITAPAALVQDYNITLTSEAIALGQTGGHLTYYSNAYNETRSTSFPAGSSAGDIAMALYSNNVADFDLGNAWEAGVLEGDYSGITFHSVGEADAQAAVRPGTAAIVTDYNITLTSEAIALGQTGGHLTYYSNAYNETRSTSFPAGSSAGDIAMALYSNNVADFDLGNAWEAGVLEGDYQSITFSPITSANSLAPSSSSSSSSSISNTGEAADNARAAITLIDEAIETVNIQRSRLGAVSNRLSHTVNNLTNISSNLSAAQGGIEDADFAKETTDLAKNQILQQASTAMLAQANASKQNVLSLLQG